MALQAGLKRGAGAHGAKVGKKLAILLTSSAIILVTPGISSAQTAKPAATARRDISFAIPAQPLTAAIKAFIRATGWQVGYPAALLQNKSSSAISGRMAPEAALGAMLAGTGISMRVTGPETVALIGEADAATAVDGGDSTVLGTITVDGTNKGVYLGTDSVSDTGTTTIAAGQIVARSAGNDANDILRNLPNVQYQNDVDDDAGVSDQDVIDLKPREVSIAGGRVYENNFLLEGMAINTVTGSEEFGTGAELDDLDRGSPPAQERFFGLHSQSVYVPTDFLQDVTVIDSNASAVYGNFQGGVVSYRMQQVSTDRWTGSVSTDFTTSDWTGYHVASKSGLNPTGVATPDYLKRRQAISISGPITDNIAILGQYSCQTAVTEKDKDYQYSESQRVGEEAQNEFYRAQIKATTDLGDFTLEGVYTDYVQAWEYASWRNMRIDQIAQGLNTKLQHDYEFSDFDLAGMALSNVRLESKLGYGTSDNINDMNGNVARAYKQTFYRSNRKLFEATELSGISDWCRTPPGITTTTICYDGATGDKEQGQEQLTWSQDLSGDVGNGSFKLGGEYVHTDAYRRRPEDATYYGVYTSKGEAGVTGFVCKTTEECNEEQYASNKTVYKAFDVDAKLNQFSAYAEVEQTWEWFNLRAGGRVSYDDYMKNVDLAPRVVATITPWQDFSISLGANRYYNAQSLAYAIRERQPRPVTSTRNILKPAEENWKELAETYFTSSATGLDTPYTDEFTVGLSGIEPLLGGQWRLRFMDRRSKDQFASDKSGNSYTLTNNGTGAYQSVSAEYSKELKAPELPGLDALLFNASVTWSKREVSNDSYYEDSFEDDYIYYKGQSYSKAGFSVVTGNMDIPVRFQTGLSSSWLDDALKLDVTANYNLAYTAALDTEDTISVDGKQHSIYEDFDFKSLMTFDLAASYEVYKKDNAGLSFNVRVENVFDQIGNGKTSDTRPWVIGRTFWVGAKATF
ncbi:hypothetical protein [Neorhizobium sp. JUb45]|uniref:TonB-dependent receptor n=1 Tax=Neorhizobium sp. JUb45 TaxID=2485113 RepID=UPI0010F2D888|nr:hypothetical protein [Neorhizobium sp. JUb45]TCR02635.1 TonB-dependent receptor-like protein [Neorhizobium sp. JUb45]